MYRVVLAFALVGVLIWIFFWFIDPATESDSEGSTLSQLGQCLLLILYACAGFVVARKGKWWTGIVAGATTAALVGITNFVLLTSTGLIEVAPWQPTLENILRALAGLLVGATVIGGTLGAFGALVSRIPFLKANSLGDAPPQE